MSNLIHFTKMHGAGNDYIYVDASAYDIEDPASAAVLLSKRHTGIGSDGLVLIGRGDGIEADFTMNIFNADGSEAKMCGNAARCIGKYVYEKGLTRKTSVRLQTLSGVRMLNLHPDETDSVASVTVDMMCPGLKNPAQFVLNQDKVALVIYDGGQAMGTFVSMGNPHFVIFTDDVNGLDVPGIGSALENNDVFPCGCNIEFAQVLSQDTIRVRVWERGSGLTMACGTGACAVTVAAAITGRSSRKVQILMDGGPLQIEWRKSNNHLYLSGPAEFVFEGTIDLDKLN